MPSIGEHNVSAKVGQKKNIWPKAQSGILFRGKLASGGFKLMKRPAHFSD